jgi:hypothetical protein
MTPPISPGPAVAATPSSSPKPTGGDLRHDAAIGAVFVDLRQNEAGEDFALARYDRGRGLVTARFDPQYDHRSISVGHWQGHFLDAFSAIKLAPPAKTRADEFIQ